MHATPLVITIGGALALIVIPAAVLVAQTFLRYHAARWAASRWPDHDEHRRREAAHTALMMGRLLDSQGGDIADLKRRVSALETGQPEPSSGDHTALALVVSSKVDKIERAMRKRGLWDSNRPGQLR